MIPTKPGSIVSLLIPDHRELAPGTLRKLIRLSGMTVEQFRAAATSPRVGARSRDSLAPNWAAR